MKRIAVYCGSASPQDPRYLELARNVGQHLAEQGIGVVYGGGKLGLMGALAEGALDAGGEVIGVIPQGLVEAEAAFTGCTELHIVSTMHQRKQAFTDLSDGFLTLPGGVGTMDELWEALSWAQLGYHTKPVGLLNAFGFYDGLITFFEQMTRVGFVRPIHSTILQVHNELLPLLQQMGNYRAHPPILQMKAADL